MLISRTPAVFWIAAALAGCSHLNLRRSEAAYKRTMDEWKGRTAELLVSRNGYPDQERTSPSGNKVYEYRRKETHTTSVHASTTYNETTNSASTTMYGGDTIEFSCVTWFELVDNKVANVTWRGNNCTALEDLPEATHLGLEIKDEAQRIRVVSSTQGKPGADAGIKDGDVITNVCVSGCAGYIQDAATFRDRLLNLLERGNSRLLIYVERDGKSRPFSVTVPLPRT